MIAAITERRGDDSLGAYDALLDRLPLTNMADHPSSATNGCKRALLDNPTIPDAARALGTSTAHFARRFNDEFGIPPHRWRLNAWLEQAPERIRSGSSVADAARSAGFRDSSHLARTCKAMTGLTPRTFAKRVQDE